MAGLIRAELRSGTINEELQGTLRAMDLLVDPVDVADGADLLAVLNMGRAIGLYAAGMHEGTRMWIPVRRGEPVPIIDGKLHLLATPFGPEGGSRASGSGEGGGSRQGGGGSQGGSIVERAFFAPYVGDQRPLKFFLSQLDGFQSEWDASVYHSPYTSLVQSSGWGKSKSIYELAKEKVFVVYCSFLSADSKGFPKRTQEVASIFQEGFTRLKGVAYLIAAANVVAQNGLDPTAWMDKHMKQADFVGKLIFDEYTVILKLLEGHDADDSFLAEELGNAVARVGTQRGASGLKLLYAFDEAKQMPNWEENFLVLRRCLSLLASGCRCFAIFSETSSKVANYSPASRMDKSTKVSKEGHKLFPPLRLVSWPDTFLGKRKRSEFGVPGGMFLFGRPMWGAFLNKGMSAEELVRLAVTKLLGGLEIDPAKVTQALAAALFGVCVGSTVVCSSSLVQDMVASHMSTLVWVSPDRELLRLCATSEPVLGEAVARLFRRYGYFNPCLSKLVGLCDDGLVLEGVRGELVARLIILLAMYKAAEATKSSFYTSPVTVAAFFEALLGKVGASKLESLRRGGGQASRTFSDGKICFNHFIPMSRTTDGTEREPVPNTKNTLPQDKLKSFYQRGAAFMFPEGEWGAEFGLPIQVGTESSMLDAQVKNLKDALGPKAIRQVGSKLAGHAGADAITLVMCFSPGNERIEVNGSEVVVVGGPEMYPAAAEFKDSLHRILKSRLGNELEKLFRGEELTVARNLTPWLYKTELFE